MQRLLYFYVQMHLVHMVNIVKFMHGLHKLLLGLIKLSKPKCESDVSGFIYCSEDCNLFRTFDLIFILLLLFKQ